MYRTTLEIHDSRKQIANPSWGAVLVFGIGAIFVPLAIMVVISYPTFGVGILAGMILSYLVWTARGFGRRLPRHVLKTGLRQIGSKESSSRREDASRADG